MMSRLRMIIVPKIPRMTHVNKKSPGVFGERFVTSRAWGLMYNGLIVSVNGLISFLRHSFTISPQSSQILKIQPLRSRRGAPLLAVVGVLLSARAHAQKLGFGGTEVDEASQLPICDKPLGTIDLVEEKTEQDPCLAALPPQFRAMMEMTQAQQGDGTAVDPLLQDGASGEIGFSSDSTIGSTMRRKTAITTGLRQRTAIHRFGSWRGSGRPVPRWRPPWRRPWPERQ